MGRIGAPFGVQGWVRVQTYSTDPDTLLDYESWWIRDAQPGSPGAIRRPGQGATRGDVGWREVEVLEAQAHGGGLIALLEGIGDRDQAARARGAEIGLLRDDLPPPEDDEYYWEDLVGIDAVDPGGNKIGVVSGLMEAGAHDVLVIDTAGRTPAGKPVQILVPFVERHVGEVDLEQKRVVVDWEEPV
jgi:16S rRNA processing protein RimM